MSKLLKLKEWLTVPEAATRLSGIFEEQVTEADVLRLALDKKLTLSIRFKDDIVIRPCKFVQHYEGSLEEAVETVSDFSTKDGRPINCKKLEIGDDQCLVFDGEMAISDGVWDLPMIGNERFVIEDRVSRLIGGAFAIDCCYAGVILSKNGQIAQLQKHFILAKSHWRPNDSVVSSLYKKIVLVKDVVTEMNRPKEKNYVPAVGLPYSADLVVRSTALRELELAISNQHLSNEKPLATTERNTLLTIIAALCDYSAIKHQERGAASQIARLTEEIGASVSADTVKRALEKIPDALDARMK